MNQLSQLILNTGKILQQYNSQLIDVQNKLGFIKLNRDAILKGKLQFSSVDTPVLVLSISKEIVLLKEIEHLEKREKELNNAIDEASIAFLELMKKQTTEDAVH